ncbi:brachyurin-like [Agrilus planipennis]|uniref:Brachyurin-like n=1 Tax=Agrilus planipennis TaxID=224129 RepID=A0A7F5RIQ2_AGRPL|nr:brachyurin-like [Agrilus planipennis]
MNEIVLIFITFSLVTAQLTSSEDVRIVGGHEAPRNSLRYQAALRLLYDGTSSFCGGSLITRRYVLTAAHCLNEDGLISLEVILGAHNIGHRESTQQRILTSTFKFHEGYSDETLVNDLGIVYLPTPANLNQYVQLITLPSRADASNSFVGSQAIVSGWGYISQSATDITDVLRYVNVYIISNDVCKQTFNSFVRNSNICSGGVGKKGVCFGDSGGPLVASGKLVGVISFISNGGCDAGDPNVMSRVSSFLDWIAANSDAVIS